MRSISWKTAVLAALLPLLASPALASEAGPGPGAAAVELSTGSTHLDGAPAGLQRLGERVAELEKRVDQLGAAQLSPPPTAAEARRARLEQEREAEFLNQIWTAP